MTLSRQTFNKVKDILRELDERISDAREERTGEHSGTDHRRGSAGFAAPAGRDEMHAPSANGVDRGPSIGSA